jgi:hypothetical protein
MSWLARLLGRAPAAPAEKVGEAERAVAIPPDIAAQLTAGGAPLGAAVETALREHLAARDEAPANGDKPFWLARDEEAGDIEERLRDRIAQRRAGDGEAER